MRQYQSYAELLNRVLSDLGEINRHGGGLPGIATGLPALDELTGGLQKTHLYILGARSGMGKTVFQIWLAAYMAALRKSVGFLSLEQPAFELVYRIASDLTDVSLTDLKRTPLGEEKIRDIGAIFQRVADNKLHIWDSYERDWDKLKVEIGRMKDEHEIDVLFVDHLNMVRSKDTRARHLEITQICHGLKEIALAMELPVFAACQVNRSAEQRDDQRPTLANLKEASAIEENADVVVLLYRKEYYLRQKQAPNILDIDACQKHSREIAKHAGKAELIVAKNRHGATGSVVCGFDGEHMRFFNLGARND